MLPNFGIMEIAIILVIALIVFGPKRLPELGKSLGKGINEFRDGLSNMGHDEEEEDEEEDLEELEPAELTAPPADDEPLPGDDPKVTENTEAEPVDGEVVHERHD